MILNSLKQIGKHSFVYSLNYIFSSLAGILLLPVYTRYLDKTNYGTLSLIDQSIYYIKIVFFLGGAAAVTRFYHYFESEREKRLVVSTGIWLALCISTLGGTLLVLGAAPIATMIFGSASFKIFLYLAAVILVSESLNSVSMSYYAAVKNSGRYVTIGLSQLLVGIACNLFFIVWLRQGAIGMVYGQATTNTVFCLVNVAIILYSTGVRFSRNICKEMVRFGLPLVPATILAALMHNSDQYILRYFCGLEAVGIYSLGYKIAFAANSVFTVSVNLVWSSSMIYEIHKEPNAKEIYARITTYIMSLLLVFMFVVSVFSEQIITLLATPTYREAYRVMPLVCLGLVPYGLNAFLSIGVNIYNKTWLVPITNGIAAVVNILLNILLIPRFGYMGAASVTVVTYVVFALAAWRIYRDVYSIPFEWSRLGLLTAACVVLYAISACAPIDSVIMKVLFRAGLCLSLPCLLNKLRFFTEVEKLKLVEWRICLSRSIRNAVGLV